MSDAPNPLKRLNPRQKTIIVVAILAIAVGVATTQSRQTGLDLTNPGLTVPPAATSSSTTSLPPTSTTTAPATTTITSTAE